MLKTQYPYIDDEGKSYFNLVKHYAEDTEGNKYYIKQIETGIEYEEAIDVFPCKYTYIATEKKVEVEEVIEEEKNVEKTID